MMDIYCLESIDPYFTEVDGTLALGQCLARRLISTRGSHPTDPNYGSDVKQWVGTNFSDAEVSIMESMVEAECLKEDRVLDVEATASLILSRQDGSFKIDIKVFTDEGPFSLTLVVNTTEASEAEVSSSVNTVVTYEWTVTDVPTLVMAKNINRKGFYYQNTSASVPVFYQWGRVTTSASLTWPANSNRSLDTIPTLSLYLSCPAGQTAVVKAEETY